MTTAALDTSAALSTSTTHREVTPGLHFSRHFTTPGVSPYDQVRWELRDAVIQDWKGKLIFEQKDVESPVDWSMTATNIVASKYLRRGQNRPARPASEC
jgi:ribonucleoside-diphosphate reductase alpha chain